MNKSVFRSLVVTSVAIFLVGLNVFQIASLDFSLSGLMIMVFGLALMVHGVHARLRELNRPSWNFILIFIPIVNGVFLLELLRD